MVHQTPELSDGHKVGCADRYRLSLKFPPISQSPSASHAPSYQSGAMLIRRTLLSLFTSHFNSAMFRRRTIRISFLYSQGEHYYRGQPCAETHVPFSIFFVPSEEEDEIFADAEDDAPLRDGPGEEPSSAAFSSHPSQYLLPSVLEVTTKLRLHKIFALFLATANMSSTNVERAPPRLVRRANKPSYADLSSPSSSSDVLHSPIPIHRHAGQCRLHDHRQRPRQSPMVQAQMAKENAVHCLSDDEPAEPAPPKKKSRKEPAARSIVNIAPERIPVIDKAYEYMYMKTLTDESRTWVHDRAELAALDRLGLNPDNFEPVTHMEKDLDFKKCARIIVAGPDGFGFLSCSAKATKEERERVADANRALVAALTDRSAHVFEINLKTSRNVRADPSLRRDPHDRTVKGSMYKHRSIGLLINRVVFANMLSEGMQYPEFFDDTFPDTDDETQPPHKPMLCLVIIAVAVTALRGAIMEYSSGHILAEDFSRKLYKSYFDAELKTLREWLNFTSNPTLIPDIDPRPASSIYRLEFVIILADSRELEDSKGALAGDRWMGGVGKGIDMKGGGPECSAKDAAQKPASLRGLECPGKGDLVIDVDEKKAIGAGRCAGPSTARDARSGILMRAELTMSARLYLPDFRLARSFGCKQRVQGCK
ncbi:hypothetical protein B0H13DRAFT_1865943 [Mycena leptocephala]|nr:hypothetical protein B0H13DRAFT_1865943 [Mycena leptocephala]